MKTKSVKKEITFIYTDKLEHQCAEPIAKEAEKRGYKVKFSDNIFEKCEIGFYCQHVNFPQFSKFSCVMLHDLGQQHGEWPVMWKNEFWNQFDIALLPSKEWAAMWHNASCYDFVRPRHGGYFAGWVKADNIYERSFSAECDEIIKKYGIDTSKKTVLYAPSWEWDNRQLEMIEACKDLNVNLIIKQFPFNPKTFSFQYQIIADMAEKSKNIPNVFVLDTSINIFNAIQLCDVLVSEESSTLYEAMMLDKPVIAVTDWLIPDALPNPPRLPDFPYDFAIHIKKSEIRDTLLKVISDSAYKEKITAYRKDNFPNIGNAAKIVMAVLDNVLYGAKNEVPRIDELPLVPTPKEFKKSVAARKRVMRLVFIKKNFVDKSRVLLAVWKLLKQIKNNLKNMGGEYSSIVSSPFVHYELSFMETA